MGLLPSLRQKKRYLALEILSPEKFSYAEIQEGVLQAASDFLGQLGLSRAGMMFLPEKWNPAQQRFLLKVNHTAVDEVKAALVLSKKIKKAPIIIRSVTVSGTLKKASSGL